MLTKNVYIVYPAGYHGNYLKWAIEVSDLDRRATTPLNPIPNTTSLQYGGQGTSHANHRIPTHQSFRTHTIWVMLNKPQDPLIYVINSGQGQAFFVQDKEYSIADLLFADRDGIVICIHDNHEPMMMSYGRINCVTKWPTYISAMLARRRNHNSTIEKLHDNFDFQNCQNDRLFRNWLVKNDVLGTQSAIDMKKLRDETNSLSAWYQVRNTAQPHEVNLNTYQASASIEGRVFELSCLDIATEAFPQILKNIMTLAAPSNNFDCSHVAEFHSTYTAAQPNLQWFNSMTHWGETGVLNSYLTSHSVIEAEVLREIFKRSNIIINANDQDKIAVEVYYNWYNFYLKVRDPSWPEISNNPQDFWSLPNHIQNELVENFGYQPVTSAPPNLAIKNLNWESMSLEDINRVYQESHPLLQN